MSQQPEQTPTPSGAKRHTGSCHCGAVRFAVTLDLGAGVTRCNCSICTKLNSTGAVVKPDAFQLLQGRESLTEYRVGQSPASRFFCKRCGVQMYGAGDIPEVGGAFVSVNVSALEGVEPRNLKVGYWDGRHDNWQAGLRPEPWPMQA